MGKKILMKKESLSSLIPFVMEGMGDALFVREDVEDDEYTIGGESDDPAVGGNYYHVDESIITESQESKSISQAKKLLMAKLGYNEMEADNFVRVTLRNDLPVLRTQEGGKFILGVTRMYVDKQLRDANTINQLNKTIKLVSSNAHINEYDRNLNGLSARELIGRFASAILDNVQNEKDELSSMQFNQSSDYQIVKINSFEEASSYGKYVSWCITHDESMFESYTSNGINQFYFCLKNGFENVDEIEGEGCPLDEYGLSMIAVSVDESGSLNTCTCRWNHDNGGDDSIMDAKQISQVIGMNFFDVFKPSMVFQEKLQGSLERLKMSGGNVAYAFDYSIPINDGYYIVDICEKRNVIKLLPYGECKFIFDEWYDMISDCKPSDVLLIMNGRSQNYATVEGNMLLDKWPNIAQEFMNGYGVVGYYAGEDDEGEYSYSWYAVNEVGQMKPLGQYSSASPMSCGFSKVVKNGYTNYIDINGNLLLDEPLVDGGVFIDDVTIVTLLSSSYRYERNILSTNGEFLLPYNVTNIYMRNTDEFGRLFLLVKQPDNDYDKSNCLYNLCDVKGNVLLSKWVRHGDIFSDGIVIVKTVYDRLIKMAKKEQNKQDSIIYYESVNGLMSWMGNSIIRDKDGNPLKMYHGTHKKFDNFDKSFIGSGGSGCYEGLGFNFTPLYGTAQWYASEEGGVKEVYLRAEHPLRSDEHKLKLHDVIKIMREFDKGLPPTDRVVAAFETPSYREKWDEAYYNRAIIVAAKQIIEYNYEYGDAGIYAELCVASSGIRMIDVFEKFGYDSCIFFNEDGSIKTAVVFEPTQIIDANKVDTLTENVEREVDSSEVDLSSFKKQDKMQPSIWKDGDKLDSRIRMKLLDIADDFWDYLHISWVEPEGIILTGSICNFNWSDKSDIDLHIIADFSKINERTDFVKEYVNTKKNEWNSMHKSLNINGFAVELYVQDINDEVSSSGIYDLEENAWISKPNSEDSFDISNDEEKIKEVSANIMTIIDGMWKMLSNTRDSHEQEVILGDASKLWDKIREMRRRGLSSEGEKSSDNIIYKELRREGYIDKLFNISNMAYDKVNSINESVGSIVGVDLSEVGSVSYDADFDEEAYNEWLSENDINDSPNSKFAYFKEYVTFNLEYFDNGTFHHMMYAEAYYDDLESEFGKQIADKIVADCIEDGEGSFETRELYEGDTVDINDSNSVSEYAKKVFRHGEYHDGARGFILPDEVMIYTEWEHNAVASIPNVNDKFQFIRMGNVRVLPQSIDIGKEPTEEQYGVIRQIAAAYSNDTLYLDLFTPNGEIGAVYQCANPNYVVGEIKRYYSEGIRPQGSRAYEGRMMEYIKHLKENDKINEEIVADGNPDHNPFQKRWKREREALKNFIVNYGDIKTSKENGKQYKVLYDPNLSSLIGFNYCLCLQWDPVKMKPSTTVYVRAMDKFTDRIFQAQYDDRGFDNMRGTMDDLSPQQVQQYS